MLEMKEECLKCFTPLGLTSEAMICSYGCTYCVKCAEEKIRFVKTVMAICKNVPTGLDEKCHDIIVFLNRTILIEKVYF